MKNRLRTLLYRITITKSDPSGLIHLGSRYALTYKSLQIMAKHFYSYKCEFTVEKLIHYRKSIFGRCDIFAWKDETVVVDGD